jgi:hypothetical protein
MNELVVADKAAERLRLNALVLDSISSPITPRVYNEYICHALTVALVTLCRGSWVYQAMYLWRPANSALYRSTSG